MKPAKPFLKWAGGKTQLLPQFQTLYPPALKVGTIRRYIEPFVGGGAVFFNVATQFNVQSFYLIDTNADLILTYRAIQREPDKLIARLQELAEEYLPLSDEARKQFYYTIRDKFNAAWLQMDYWAYSDAWIERAVQLLFMNRTCFNGLFRLNSKGQFNVPHGKYKNPKIVNAENLHNVSSALQKAELICGDFTTCEPWVTEDTFVYFDPPYRPLNATSNFTSYSQNGFKDADQVRLAALFQRLATKRNVYLMMSNSDPTNETTLNENPQDDFLLRLYNGFHIHSVRARRSINSRTTGRRRIKEIVVTNYATSSQFARTNY